VRDLLYGPARARGIDTEPRHAIAYPDRAAAA
jgi:hypothetical protein